MTSGTRAERCLPQAVRRTELPAAAAAMFGTSSLRPQERAPSPGSIYLLLQPKTIIKNPGVSEGSLAVESRRDWFPVGVISSGGESRTEAAGEHG